MYLYAQWQQTADDTIELNRPCCDFYPPHSDTGQVPLTIWVPLAAK